TDPDPRFRAQAVRILRENIDQNLAVILPLANDDNAEVRLEILIALRNVPTRKAGDALLQLSRRVDALDQWYLPTLGGALRHREPELIGKLFTDVGSAAAEAGALAVAWQINRSESIPFLAGVLKTPKMPDHFQKALDCLSWIKDAAAGEAAASIALQ